MKTVLLEIKNKLAKEVIKEIKVIENTQFVILISGENHSVFNLQFIFEKSGVSAEVLGVFNVQKGCEIKIITSSKHIAPNTSCNTFIRAVINDKSVFDYQGKIIIGKKAVQTTAYLHDDVLVAGQGTKRNSQPVLEIDNNNVKASHGSTTGRIDEEQLYYLTSRGVKELEAKEIIKEGYLGQLVVKIKDEKIREKVLNKLKSNRE